MFSVISQNLLFQSGDCFKFFKFLHSVTASHLVDLRMTLCWCYAKKLLHGDVESWDNAAWRGPQKVSRPTSCLKQSIPSSAQDAEAFIEMGLEEPLRRETAQTLERVLIMRKRRSAPRLLQGALAAAQLAAHLSPGPSPELLPVPAGVSAGAGPHVAPAWRSRGSCCILLLPGGFQFCIVPLQT